MMNPPSTSTPESEKESSSLNPGHQPPMIPPSGFTPPPPPLYHGYPPQTPFPGYPDPSYHHFHHPSMQPQHINNAYYNSSHFQHIYQEPRRGYSLARAILCLITVLVIVVTSMSLFFWVIFGTNIPRFEVESLDVPVFEINNSTIHAIFEAKLIVQNPNKRLTATFEQIEGRLVYKDILIDGSMVDPIFNLGSNEQKVLVATFSVPSPDYNYTAAFWLQQLEEDRKKGDVGFSLRFVTSAMFSSAGVWRRRLPLAIICDDLEVQFPGETGGGKWNGSKKECFLTV